MSLPFDHNGETLKKYLKRNKIKQEDFADKLEISRNYFITKLKEDKFKDDFKVKVITLLGVSEDFFESNNNSGEKGGNISPIQDIIVKEPNRPYGESPIEKADFENREESNQVVVPLKTYVGVADEIAKLKKLLDEGALTPTEYDAQKKKLLNV